MNQGLPNDFDSQHLLIQTLQQFYKDFLVLVLFGFVLFFASFYSDEINAQGNKVIAQFPTFPHKKAFMI